MATGAIIEPINPSKNCPLSTTLIALFAPKKGVPIDINLSSWDVSSVTNMRMMFYMAGYSATTFNIGNIASWNTSNVTDMKYMFRRAGYNATYSLNLSSWNVNNVTDHTDFNSGVESKVTAPTWVN